MKKPVAPAPGTSKKSPKQLAPSVSTPAKAAPKLAKVGPKPIKSATKPVKRATKLAKPATPRTKPGNTSLVARLKIFVEAYLTNGGNATEAAITAGYSAKTAATQGARLLKRADVKAELQARQKQIQDKLEITTESVLRELARLSFFDARNFFNADGSPKAIGELDDDTAAALVGLDVVEEFRGTGEARKFVGYVRKYKLPDKGANLERLGRHLGLFEKDNKQRAGLLGDLPRDTVKLIVDRLKEIAARRPGVA